jgi:hypothetical protein
MKDSKVDLAAIEKEGQEESQTEAPRTALVFESREIAGQKIETDANKDSTSSESTQKLI